VIDRVTALNNLQPPLNFVRFFGAIRFFVAQLYRVWI
jgi:hypothetical protein